MGSDLNPVNLNPIINTSIELLGLAFRMKMSAIYLDRELLFPSAYGRHLNLQGDRWDNSPLVSNKSDTENYYNRKVEEINQTKIMSENTKCEMTVWRIAAVSIFTTAPEVADKCHVARNRLAACRSGHVVDESRDRGSD